MVNTLAVLVAAQIVGGIQYDSLGGLLVASLLLGVLNAVVRPIMILLALPLMVLTLGLFFFVINGLLLYLIGMIVKTFHVSGFGSAFLGALVISVVSTLANWLFGTSQVKATVKTRPPQKSGPAGGSGPIIDV